MHIACGAPMMSELPDLQKRRDRSDEGGAQLGIFEILGTGVGSSQTPVRLEAPAASQASPPSRQPAVT